MPWLSLLLPGRFLSGPGLGLTLATGGLVFGLAFEQGTLQPAGACAWPSASRGALLDRARGVAAGLLASLVGGSASPQLPERRTPAPNEGLWRSGKRGLAPSRAEMVSGLLREQASGLIRAACSNFTLPCCLWRLRLLACSALFVYRLPRGVLAQNNDGTGNNSIRKGKPARL